MKGVLCNGKGGKSALCREAACAYLNACDPGVKYGMTCADVIAKCKQALGSGGDVDGCRKFFEDMNNRGCAGR